MNMNTGLNDGQDAMPGLIHWNGCKVCLQNLTAFSNYAYNTDMEKMSPAWEFKVADIWAILSILGLFWLFLRCFELFLTSCNIWTILCYFALSALISYL